MLKNVFLSSVILMSGIIGCSESDPEPEIDPYYRQQMRSFVVDISDYAHDIDSNFIVIPQNGVELITENGEPDGALAGEYIDAIDGQGQEDFNFGYEDDGIPTPADDRAWLKGFIDVAEDNGIEALITDYCGSTTQIDASYSQNESDGYTGFATTDRELSTIPAYPSDPYNQNYYNITSLSDTQNFLYLLNSENYATKSDYLTALGNTDHDMLIIDLYYEDTELSLAEVTALKTKNGGGSRLVIAYMSIGEAEDYRYYWDPAWETSPPEWLAGENPDWEGNYLVRYWYRQWQDIIFGNDDSYLKKILDAGFDGVYLDIIEAYEYFE